MNSSKPYILIVDDNRSQVEILVNMLEYENYRCDRAYDGETACALLRRNNYDLALVDLKLPDISGLDVLKLTRRLNVFPQVVMISGRGDIRTAVEATRSGAFDFLEKPLDTDRVLVTLKNALEKSILQQEKNRLLDDMRREYQLVGESEVMIEMKELIQKAAATDTKVLIQGENGTGKELVARAIFMNSRRAARPFVAVNCAAIPDTLIESELFGHKKGAFTGAVADKAGRFQQADGGTIFLDEIGDMSLMTQAKVLRVLAENTLEMVGGSKLIEVDVRVIAATNKNLMTEISRGSFREDLYFRLNVLNIQIPPLRTRRSDIPLLVDHFLNRFCSEQGLKPKKLDSAAMEYLVNYSWPGNVRELRNVVEKIVVVVDTVGVGLEDITSIMTGDTEMQEDAMRISNLREAKRIFERRFIAEKLLECDGNISEAARVMGITRSTLYKKLYELDILEYAKGNGIINGQ
jgi:two-component system nitrogen regulation response regulator NtrX